MTEGVRGRGVGFSFEADPDSHKSRLITGDKSMSEPGVEIADDTDNVGD